MRKGELTRTVLYENFGDEDDPPLELDFQFEGLLPKFMQSYPVNKTQKDAEHYVFALQVFVNANEENPLLQFICVKFSFDDDKDYTYKNNSRQSAKGYLWTIVDVNYDDIKHKSSKKTIQHVCHQANQIFDQYDNLRNGEDRDNEKNKLCGKVFILDSKFIILKKNDVFE